MSNNLVQIIRKKFRETLARIRPQYNQPSFVEFLSKPVEESKEPLKEGSKIFQQFESIIDEKYREFTRTFQADEKKIVESLVKEPTEYIKNAQLKTDYVEFLMEYTAQYAMLRPGELREKLENSDQRPPYLWMEFQQKQLGKDLIDRLEKIRTDPQFQDYIKAKERWKEDMKSRQPPITGDKAIDNHLKYVEILPQVHRWIMKQLYMDFRHHNQANFFKFLEKDFTDQKQLAREKVQKQQMQRQQQQQMPQQNHPYEQAKQPGHYDPMKQQQQQQPQMSSHQSAYDPMKQQQQQQLGSQPSPYDSSSMKQNPQQMHQYGAYDTNRNAQQQQQQPSHYGDSSKMHNQGIQNQYSTPQGQQQYQQQNPQYNQQQQQQNNSYDMINKSQYDSMKQQYPQQNMYESGNKMSQQMNAYDPSSKQQSSMGYDPSKQYQGHQMNQINTHASPQLAHGSHMNQNAMQQRGVAGPNANRNAKMMGAHLAGSQGQGAHNYQQTSSQHQNMASQQMHNQAQISAGQSPRTLPSPSVHQNAHSQQQMLAQQQQMHSSQSSHPSHMQHMQSTIPNQASPHQNANNHYSMNSSYNPHQNMSQMHQQGKMGLPSPNPNQSHQSSTNPSVMSHSSMMNQSQTSGHYGSQQSSMQGQQQGRQMPGQNPNSSQVGPNQIPGQYSSQMANASMGREKIDSLNARQSLSQQSQYSNSDSLTPRQSLSQNQNQSQNQNMYQQSQNQAADAQARAQAQAEAERLRAEAQARAQAQAEAERLRVEAQARAEAQARERETREREAREAREARERAQAEARERERAQAEAQAQARAQAQAQAEAERARAEAQAQARAEAERLRAEAQAQAKAHAEAQAKEAAMKRQQQLQQQQQAQQAALNAQQDQRRYEPLKPKLIHKEKFDLAFNFDTDLHPFSDFGTGLNEVSEKFKHPYGNSQVIEAFERKVREEEYAKDESIAEIEQQAQAQKKRVKVNPSFEEELNLIPSASTSTSTKESHITNIPAPIPEVKQPILKPVERELNELKMDPRVKVDERGSLSVSPYIDTIFYRMNDGIISYHEKLVLKIFQDETKGIEIQEMANISDFMSEYNDTIFYALKDAKVKVLVETWLEFIDMCAQKANSKIQDLDDLFG